MSGAVSRARAWACSGFVACVVTACAGTATDPPSSAAPQILPAEPPTDPTTSAPPAPPTMTVQQLRFARRPEAFAPPTTSPGDWSYLVGAVNGGVAIYNGAGFTGTTRTCNDLLYVPVNATGTTNFYVFDNLYKTDAKGTACIEPSPVPSSCNPSPSPDNHCPRLAWSLTLDGAMDRDSVTSSLDGSRLYVATTHGKLYAIDQKTHAIGAVFDAAADTGSSNATFAGTAPWIDYLGGGSIYVAVSYASDAKSRVYKLKDGGASFTKIASADVASGTRSSPILYNAALYLPTMDGKLRKVADSGSTLTETTHAPWPVQLLAASGSKSSPDAAVPIYASPTIDGDVDVMILPVNNVLWSIKLTVGSNEGKTDWTAMGWNTTTQAKSTNVANYASSMLYVDPTFNVRVAIYAHGDATQKGSANSVWVQEYANDGTFQKSALGSATVQGAFSSMTDPKSSPLLFQPPGSGVVYGFIGDQGGFLNRWTYNEPVQLLNHVTFPATGPSSVGSIESPILVDVIGGNVYFGANGGRVYQLGQVSLK